MPTPELTKKRLLAECRSSCPFCGETNVATFEYHHINCDHGDSSFENLIVACGSCHNRITHGEITQEQVCSVKRSLAQERTAPSDDKGSVCVTMHGSEFKGNIAQSITINKYGRKPPPRRAPIPGSIGASIAHKGYIDYLLTKYHEWRKRDADYGRFVEYKPAVIHVLIQRRFGCRTFDIAVNRFDALVEFLQEKIDGTIQGKVNRKAGTASYHSFATHCERFSLHR